MLRKGKSPFAPAIGVTFNQPMVPLTTLEDLSAADVPVTVKPDIPGTWRWLGTKTLTFEYDSELIDRLPMASEFRVTVPQGTKSASGSVLAGEVSWTFHHTAAQNHRYLAGSRLIPAGPAAHVHRL